RRRRPGTRWFGAREIPQPVRPGTRRVPALSANAAPGPSLRGAAVQAPATASQRGGGAYRRGDGFPGGGGSHPVAALLRSRRVSIGLAVRECRGKTRGSCLCERASGRAVIASVGRRPRLAQYV